MSPRTLAWLLVACAACGPTAERPADEGSAGDPRSDAAEVSTAVPLEAPVQVGEVELDEAQLRTLRRLSPLPAPPPDPTNRVADDPAAAHLGQFLFFDKGLSADGTVSCATCHKPELGFGDDEGLAVGLDVGTRHAPSLLNVAYMRWLGWGGKADSLWAQATGPLENPVEMASSRVAVARHVYDTPALREAYEALFEPLPDLADSERFPPHARPVPDDPEHPHALAWETLTADDRGAVERVFVHVAKCIAAYQRKLVRGGSRFDRFVAALNGQAGGDLGALSPAELRGMEHFLAPNRCTLCHFGPNLSDSEFHNTGAPPLPGGEVEDPGRYTGQALVVADPFNANGPHSDERDGVAARRVRGLVQRPEAWGEFRTPSLRNLAQRTRFMHQGQFEGLGSVLHFYNTLEGFVGRSHHQEQVLTPMGLDAGQLEELAAFLLAMEGAPLPGNLTRPPASPLAAR